MAPTATSEEPTDRWADFHCQSKPLADMYEYQSPRSSSSGSGDSIDGDPWLDCAMTTDSDFLILISSKP